MTKDIESPDGKISTNKKSLMYVLILTIWALIIIWFSPRLFAVFSSAYSISAFAILLTFILFLYSFWLYGVYYIILFIFSLMPKKKINPVELKECNIQKVAVLYLTMNDFQHTAAFSCINQDYPDFHVFILDDSTKIDFIEKINEFKSKHTERVTIIRRAANKGYKAGNINNALQYHIKDYPLIAIMDSDEVLQTDFLKKVIPYFKIDDKICFVQGSHYPNPNQKTAFAKDLSIGIVPFWKTLLGPRNEYGFVVFLGHGGIISRKIWEDTGGFPEVVSEDLAFSAKAAELGYRGYYANEVISYEDFPGTFQQFRKQQDKYVKGFCEFLDKNFSSFVKSKKILWFEKLDVLIPFSMLFMPAFILVFLVFFSFVMPSAFADIKPLHLWIGSHRISLGNIFVFSDNLNAIWKWDFYALTLIIMLSSFLSCIKILIHSPKQTIKFLFLSSSPYFSRMFTCFISILSYAINKKAIFTATGEKQEETENKKVNRYIHRNSVIYFVELLTGVVFTILCFKMINLALLAFSFSLIVSFFIYILGWESKILFGLKSIPFFLVILSIVLLGSNLIAAQGMLLPYFMINF